MKEFKVFISLKNIIKNGKPIIKEQNIVIFFWLILLMKSDLYLNM
jgi:hypothetical protein